MKNIIAILCCVSVSSAVYAGDDTLVSDFRKLLDDLLREANKNLSAVYSLPEVQEELTKKSDGWLYLRHGYLDNLQNMIRDGDCIVQMDDNIATATAYVYFNEMPFWYTIASDSRTYPNVTGLIRGELCSISGKLVVLADLTDTSNVTARVESFHLESPTIFMMDPTYNKRPANDFGFDMSTAVHEMLRTVTTPYVQQYIEKVIKATVPHVTISMKTVTSTTSTVATTQHATYATLTASKNSNTSTYSTLANNITTVTSSSQSTTTSRSKESTVTTSTSQQIINSSTVSLPDEHITTARTTNTLNNKVPANKLVTNKPTYFGQENPSIAHEISFDVQNRSKGRLGRVLKPSNGTTSPMLGETISPYIVISLTPAGTGSEYPPHSTIKCEITPSNITVSYQPRLRVSTSSDPVQQEWLTQNFNTYFDLLLHQTDMEFVSERSAFFILPDDEEEMYVLSDGSITLDEGNINGLGNLVLEADPFVEREGGMANATVEVNFSNITYCFDFSAKSKTYGNNSLMNGTVRGNMTSLQGQLIILANLTDSSAVRAVVDSFQLLPTVEIAMNVELPASSVSNMTDEINDAVIRNLKKDVVRRLQHHVADIFRSVISSLQEDMNPTSTTTPVTTTIPATTTSATIPTTTTSFQTTTPSSSNTITASLISSVISLLLHYVILLLT